MNTDKTKTQLLLIRVYRRWRSSAAEYFLPFDFRAELNENLNNVSHSGGEEICVPLDRSSPLCCRRFAVECRLAADREPARRRYRPAFSTGPVLRGVSQPEERHCRNCPQRNRFRPDRKSTRLNSSHLGISYAVFC